MNKIYLIYFCTYRREPVLKCITSNISYIKDMCKWFCSNIPLLILLARYNDNIDVGYACKGVSLLLINLYTWVLTWHRLYSWPFDTFPSFHWCVNFYFFLFVLFLHSPLLWRDIHFASFRGFNAFSQPSYASFTLPCAALTTANTIFSASSPPYPPPPPPTTTTATTFLSSSWFFSGCLLLCFHLVVSSSWNFSAFFELVKIRAFYFHTFSCVWG